jgi:putative membrane protein insertion efficiency factor
MEKYIKALTLILLRIILSFKNQIFPPGACRYQPTCSQYAIEAFSKHRFIKALALVVNRLVKCNPMFFGGEDPVPEPTKKEKIAV